MNRWFGVAIVIALLTVVIFLAGPSWLLRACNDTGDCGAVSPLVVGFAGAFLSACFALIGMLSSSRVEGPRGPGDVVSPSVPA